ncbi:hypothetical protein [Kitasatospora sp. CB01950]|uniref:hypothetical protein n=1 Tax=Kitasatospora sp. CB01950 TaxID=1703930 RepID=UPI00093AD841|nr:hypothetical protein [Kitasatospora sp. CB01950]OKJ08194.1 hypothetical protein AMK19_19375 [Kitasatospora sp. CB01950]
MEETDRARAVAGLRAATVGVGIGLALVLLVWGGMALFGDGGLPSGIAGVAVIPAGTPISALWQRRPVNRRPALLVAALLFLLVAVFTATLGDGLSDDPEEEAGIGWLLLGYFPGALLFGAAFGGLAGPPADEPGRNWLRFTGRGRRLHLAAYGTLAALLGLNVAAAAVVG